MSRVAGVITVKANGEQYSAKGNFTWNLGQNKREDVIGADGPHGYKEIPQVSSLEGEFTDRGDLSVKTLVQLKEATITLELANGKVIVWRDAWYSGDGNVQTEEANINVRFSSASPAEEVRA